MELPKALLGAILLGIAVESSSCQKCDDMPQPTTEQTDGEQTIAVPQPADPCPACGMG